MNHSKKNTQRILLLTKAPNTRYNTKGKTINAKNSRKSSANGKNEEKKEDLATQIFYDNLFLSADLPIKTRYMNTSTKQEHNSKIGATRNMANSEKSLFTHQRSPIFLKKNPQNNNKNQPKTKQTNKKPYNQRGVLPLKKQLLTLQGKANQEPDAIV